MGLARAGAHARHTRARPPVGSLFYGLAPHAVGRTGAFSADWIAYYDAAQHAGIQQRLARIADFFHTVVCAFVVRDFKLLFDQYTKQTQADFLVSM